MNGYDLTRAWYNFKFENSDKVRHVHSDFYFYLVDKWNRLGQLDKFGLPTDVTMQALGIGSYNTYKKVLNDLIEFGFVKLIKNSKNGHQSKIVALSKIDKATDKALDKATAKASDEVTDEVTDTIIEQRTIEQKTTKHTIIVNPKSDLPIDSRKELHKQRLKNFDASCEKMLQFYNRVFSKQSRVVNDKTKAKLKKLLFDYDWKDIANAMIEVKNNKHHAENNYRWATLEFFTRPEKIEMYAFPSNAKPIYTGEDAGLVNHVQNYYNKS